MISSYNENVTEWRTMAIVLVTSISSYNNTLAKIADALIVLDACLKVVINCLALT